MCAAAPSRDWDARSGRSVPERASRRVFLAASALVFAGGATSTIHLSLAMAGMGEVPMAGGWSMSTAWTSGCGGTRGEAAASFLAMWVAMTAAMMTPALVPMLARYREALGEVGEPRLGLLTALAGVGYFLVWTAIGLAIFALGDLAATAALDRPELARAAPLAAGLVVVIAGALQFSAWKRRQLAACADRLDHAPATAFSALRRGLALGLRCGRCCAGPTAVLLVAGVMDLGAMAVVGAAVLAERLHPRGDRIASLTGAVAVGAGLVLIARAAGLA